MNIVLIGFKSCGKSFFGKMLAEALTLSFIDLDVFIEKQYGQSSAQIFQEKGEFFFRQLEQQCLFSLKGVKRSVVATGGGAILKAENRLFLKNLGVVVYLEVDQETLRQRIAAASCVKGDFAHYYQERRFLYEEMAYYKVAANRDKELVLEELKVIYGK